MSDLISRSALYDEVATIEEKARKIVLNTPIDDPAYIRLNVQLNERTAFKHMVADAPIIEAVPVVHGHNNNQNYHEVDEFRCSVCGLHLEGWERHVYDEDRDDEFIKEYAFKYCPECGAMIGGAE